MVRKLGVSHKSLLVPSVTEGTYGIRYEHADYLDRNFNITVGSGLPTTFSYAMTEKSYNMLLEFPSTTLLTNASITEGDVIAFNNFYIRNAGNISAYAWYNLSSTALNIDITNVIGPVTVGDAYTVTIGDEATTAAPGAHTIDIAVGPAKSPLPGDWMPYTDLKTETLTITEWATDVTFIATAPGISDLHGVEVFIDDVSMGTT